MRATIKSRIRRVTQSELVEKPLNKSFLRKVIRTKRKSLSITEQHLASQRIFRYVATHCSYKSAKDLGFYIANDGEISADLLMKLALKLNKNVYLPRLTAVDSMEFRRFQNQGELVLNRFGILEPGHKQTKIEQHLLDIVFVPLVAFDSGGNRLGMGGGYYDRTFAFKQKYPKRGPRLIGLAHECQRVDDIASERWDIKMDFIVTDKGIF